MPAFKEVTPPKVPWDEVVKRKRAIQAAAIQPYSIQGTPPSPAITDIQDVDGLVDLLAAGKLSAEDVVLSYIQR